MDGDSGLGLDEDGVEGVFSSAIIVILIKGYFLFPLPAELAGRDELPTLACSEFAVLIDVLADKLHVIRVLLGAIGGDAFLTEPSLPFGVEIRLTGTTTPSLLFCFPDGVAGLFEFS